MSKQDFERGYTKPDTTEMRKTKRDEHPTATNKGLYSDMLDPDEKMTGGFAERNNTQDRL